MIAVNSLSIQNSHPLDQQVVSNKKMGIGQKLGQDSSTTSGEYSKGSNSGSENALASAKETYLKKKEDFSIKKPQ
ncbi:hypothetical protein DID78_03335 [Candidatus Marinamargulisbacteria bacterium SCGC AG-343-D04]|nr:hypothetical protein DID78_03335 [Candidatus Marinamargulisbacteria bacterium SCGC AG-343-D04]